MIPSNQSADIIESLLLDMLAPIRGNDDTLLDFEIDSQAIAKSVWESFVTSLSPKQAQQWGDWPSIESALSNLVQQTLARQTPSPGADKGAKESQLSTIDNTMSSPALWLDRLIKIMLTIDRRTFEILALRIEGYDDRDISEHLETGLRCVKHITQQTQLAWNEKLQSLNK